MKPDSPIHAPSMTLPTWEIPQFSRVRLNSLVVGVLWTGILWGSLLWNVHQASQAVLDEAYAEARASIQRDLVFRSWGTKHGGVYVPISEWSPPNPYLTQVDERDITTPLGKKLTLINPAYMIRQVQEVGKSEYGPLGHLTSLNPVRPQNAADPWERKVLQEFQEGKKEVAEILDMSGEEDLRLMQPLYAEDSCLKCHASQGYQVGDVRGGISVTVSLEPYWRKWRGLVFPLAAGHGSIWLLGLAGIVLGAKHLRQRQEEQMRAFMVLRESEERYHSLANVIEQAFEAVVITDPQRRIRYANPAFTKITGYARDAVVGLDIRILESGMHDQDFYRDLDRSIESGQVWKGCFINKRTAGSFYSQETIITPLYDQAGTVTGYVSVGRDVTQELKMEEKLRQAQKLEAVGQLAGGVAHDFNNLLQGILGFTQMAQARLQPEEDASRDLQQVLKAADRASTLVRQLLIFSREQAFQPKHLDLNTVLGDLLMMLRRLIGEQINLEVNPGFNLRKVCVDPGQVEQLVLNLCINARDAMPNGGRIRITTSNAEFDADFCATHPWAHEGAFVLLEISDTGEGMAPSVLEHIFEPFFTTKQVGQGTGLGLAIVYSIVKGHGGLIDVETSDGSGSTFKICFPVSEGVSAEVRATQNHLAVGGTETILLAEDDETVRDYTREVLERNGYHVLAVQDGEEAIQVLREEGRQINLGLFDVMMPKKSGRAVYEYAKSEEMDFPVLFVSGYSLKILDASFVPDERVHILYKPFGAQVLLEKVREVLDSTGPPSFDI